MKRRRFLQGLAFAPPLLLGGCTLNDVKLPTTPTIFTGIVINENDKPVEGFVFSFDGNSGGLNAKPTFSVNTKTDAKGYYYLEKIVPEGTEATQLTPDAKNNYPDGLYEKLCFIKGSYQTNIPTQIGQKNEFNFKIFKRK